MVYEGVSNITPSPAGGGGAVGGDRCVVSCVATRVCIAPIARRCTGMLEDLSCGLGGAELFEYILKLKFWWLCRLVLHNHAGVKSVSHMV